MSCGRPVSRYRQVAEHFARASARRRASTLASTRSTSEPGQGPCGAPSKKFIEDTFLSSQRLDPEHRRPLGLPTRRARSHADRGDLRLDLDLPRRRARRSSSSRCDRADGVSWALHGDYRPNARSMALTSASDNVTSAAPALSVMHKVHAEGVPTRALAACHFWGGGRPRSSTSERTPAAIKRRASSSRASCATTAHS
jgi:hypothetical protein